MIDRLENLLIVIAGLDPAIHRVFEEGWMPGSSPDMTTESDAARQVHLRPARP
jgi:hypothetical protein